MNYVKILDETTGELKEAILMRVEAVSSLEDKLVFFNGEYDRVEISLINKDGDYLVHGRSLKNSNFFEYFKSYNQADSTVYKNMTQEITSDLGAMRMLNSKGEECIISHIPLKSLNAWYLLAYIPARDLGGRSWPGEPAPSWQKPEPWSPRGSRKALTGDNPQLPRVS